MLVAAGSFSGKPNVLVMIMLVAIFGLIMLGVVAGEMGKRTQPPGEGEGAKASDDQGASAQ